MPSPGRIIPAVTTLCPLSEAGELRIGIENPIELGKYRKARLLYTAQFKTHILSGGGKKVFSLLNTPVLSVPTDPTIGNLSLQPLDGP